jgi:hypothetical protein
LPPPLKSLPPMRGIYIMEGQREASPPLYNLFPFPLSRALYQKSGFLITYGTKDNSVP